MLREITDSELRYRRAMNELRRELGDVLRQESRAEPRPTAEQTDESASMIDDLFKRMQSVRDELASERAGDELGSRVDWAMDVFADKEPPTAKDDEATLAELYGERDD